MFAGFRRDEFSNANLEKTVGVEYRRQCWSVQVSYSDLVDDRQFIVLFSLSGLGARLPLSMVGLGIVLLVSAATGSYGVAGAVSAAYMLANAVFSILQGRLIDTLGQARVLGLASAAFGVSTAMLVWSVQADWPIGTSYVFAALGGAALPHVGSAVRARWSYVLDRPADVHTANAHEAVAS